MPLALPGATAATRYVGGTASGAPASGTVRVGDFCIDQSGKVFVCTAAGSPGTWVELGSGGIPATIFDAKGDLIAASAADTAARLAVGSNGAQLVGASAEASGLKWALREELAAQWDEPSTNTNIGTSYVDVYTATNSEGHWCRLQTNGFTQYRVDLGWNKIGAGTQAVRVVDTAGVDVLHEFTNAVSGSQTSGLVALPAAYVDALKTVKIQAKSDTATDDPVFEWLRIFLK